jgi:glycosyltransferase involved in cell wall biosynthesis
MKIKIFKKYGIEGGGEVYANQLYEILREKHSVKKVEGNISCYFEILASKSSDKLIINITNIFDFFLLSLCIIFRKSFYPLVHIDASWRSFKSRFLFAFMRFNLIRSNKILFISEHQCYDFKIFDNFHNVGSIINKSFIQSNPKKYYQRDFDIGYFSRFAEEKGCYDFLNSLSEISKRMSVIIVGDINIKNENLINKKLFNHDVKILQKMNSFEIAKLLCNTKLVVQPSYSDTRSLLTQEALCCGSNVVAYDISSAKELAKEFNISLIKAGDLVGLSKFIENKIASSSDSDNEYNSVKKNYKKSSFYLRLIKAIEK